MNDKHNKTLLILGAAGKAGHRLCQQALDAGYKVDVIVRSPEKLSIAPTEALTIIKGDLTDQALLASTLKKPYDAVLSTVGIFHRTKETPVADITSGIIKQMEQSGQKRLVVMSSLGVAESRGQGNFAARLVSRIFLKYVVMDKEVQEQHIRNSKLEWTVIRPPQLVDSATTAPYSRWENSPPKGQSLSWKISNADAVAAMLAVLDEPESIGKAYQVSY